MKNKVGVVRMDQGKAILPLIAAKNSWVIGGIGPTSVNLNHPWRMWFEYTGRAMQVAAAVPSPDRDDYLITSKLELTTEMAPDLDGHVLTEAIAILESGVYAQMDVDVKPITYEESIEKWPRKDPPL